MLKILQILLLLNALGILLALSSKRIPFKDVTSREESSSVADFSVQYENITLDVGNYNEAKDISKTNIKFNTTDPKDEIIYEKYSNKNISVSEITLNNFIPELDIDTRDIDADTQDLYTNIKDIDDDQYTDTQDRYSNIHSKINDRTFEQLGEKTPDVSKLSNSTILDNLLNVNNNDEIKRKSNPMTYSFDETLYDDLKYKLGFNSTGDNDHVKRENARSSKFLFDKIQMKSLEKVQIDPEIQNKQKFGILNYGEKVLICSSTDGGSVQTIILSNMFEKEKEIFTNGTGPCEFLLVGDVVLLLTVENESNDLIISNFLLREGKVKQMQVIPNISEGQLVDIYTWPQKFKPFFAIKIHKNIGASTVSEFYIYTMENQRFKFLQKFLGFASANLLFFNIGIEQYIVITNYIGENTHSSTEIFQYSFYQNKYNPYQTLVTKEASSVISVNVDDGSKEFLIITRFCDDERDFCNPNTNALIYKHNGDSFVPYQQIGTTGAIKSIVLKHKGETFLCILSLLKGISVFQFNNNIFIEVFPKLNEELLMKGLSDAISLELNDDSIVGFKSILDKDTTWMLYRVNFDMINTISYSAISDWCYNALRNLNLRFEEVRKNIEEHGENASKYGKLFEPKIRNYIDPATANLYSDFQIRTNKTSEDLNVLKEKLREIDGRISDSINIDDTINWPDDLYLSSIYILAAKVKGLYIENVGDKRIPSKDELIPLNNGSATLNLLTKTFSDIEFQQSLRVQHLNDEPLSAYITLTGDHALKGHIIFKQLITSKLNIGGLIDGLRIDNENVLVKRGSFTFKGPLRCKSVHVSNLETDYINDVNIKELMKNSFVQNSTKIIKGDVDIYGDLIYPSDLRVGSLFGKDTKFFKDDLLYLNSGRSQIITGHYRIKNVKADDIHILKTLNSIPFSDSVFINLPVKFYHLSKARFDSVSAKKVHIDKSINDIKVLDGKLDLITLNDDQIVVGQKSFDGMHLNNYFVKKNPTSFISTETYSSFNNTESFDKEFRLYRTTAKFQETLKNENEILVSLYALWTELIKLIDSKPKKIQQSFLPYDENTYPLISNLLTSLTSKLETLNDRLIIENFLQIENELELSNIDNLQLNRLSSFKTLPNYLLNTVIHFYDTVDEIYDKVENLIAHKKTIISALEENINRYDRKLQDEVLKHFGTDVGSKGSFVRDLINGYDFRNISSALRRNGDNSLIDEAHIVNKVKNADWVIFRKGLNTPNINTINIKRLLEESVPFSSKETDLNLVFEGDVVVQRNVETPYVNNDITSKFAKINQVNVFIKEMEFKVLRFFADVEVKGNVNKLKLKDFASRVARTIGPQKFTVPISFNSVTAERTNASVVTLNRIPIEDYILSSEDHVLITGKKQFGNISVLNSLVSIKNLHTKELDKIDLTKAMEDKRKVEQDVVIEDKTFNKLIVKGDVNILRYLRSNDNSSPLNITRLYKDSVRWDKNETILGSLAFTGNVQAKSLKFTTSFDGISAKSFEEGFVIQNKDQIIHENNYFKALRVKNLNINNNLLHGINFTRLVNEAAKIDEDHEFLERAFFGNITSRNPIDVTGLVQGWNLTQDAILNNEPSIITGRKTFLAPVTTGSDIVVHGLVNKMHLGSICKSIAGEVEIRGKVLFEKDVTIDRIEIGSHIIPNNYTTYWMKDEPTIINADIVFNDVSTEGVHILTKLNGESIRNILEGPIPPNCEDVMKISNLTVNTLICEDLKVIDIQVDKLDGENSTILTNILLDSHDQSFEDDLKVTDLEVTGQLSLGNTINGYFMSDFCLKGYSCHIESHKTFLNDFIVYKNWEIENESRINNITIQDMKWSNVSSTQIVIVQGSVNASTIIVKGLVQGIKFSEDTVMTLSTPQTMNGTFFISNKGQLAFKALDAKVLSQLYNWVNISALEPYQQVKDNEHGDDLILSQLLEKTKLLGNEMLYVHSVLQDQPVRFNGWETTYIFHGVQIISLEQRSNSKFYLLALITPSVIHLKNYIPHIKHYKDFAYLKVNCTTDVNGFYIRDELFISASVDCPNQNLDLGEALQVSPDSISINENIFSYVWKITPKGSMLYAAIATGRIHQILSFKISGRNCMLFLSRDDVRQNIICEDKQSLILHQSLDIRKIIKAMHFELESSFYFKSFLVIGSEGSLNQMPKITLLELNNKINHYETIQRIPAERLIWLASVNFKGSVYVASVHKPFLMSLDGYINIYRLEEISLTERNNNSVWRLILQESIYLADPLQATLLQSPSDQIFLLVLNKNEFIMRYVKTGYGKFRLDGSIHIRGAKSFSPFIGNNVAVSVREDCYGGFASNNSKVIVLKPLFEGWEESFN